MYERSYLKQVKSRVEEPRKFIQVILRPRQVGKTRNPATIIQSEVSGV